NPAVDLADRGGRSGEATFHPARPQARNTAREMYPTLGSHAFRVARRNRATVGGLPDRPCAPGAGYAPPRARDRIGPSPTTAGMDPVGADPGYFRARRGRHHVPAMRPVTVVVAGHEYAALAEETAARVPDLLDVASRV